MIVSLVPHCTGQQKILLLYGSGKQGFHSVSRQKTLPRQFSKDPALHLIPPTAKTEAQPLRALGVASLVLETEPVRRSPSFLSPWLAPEEEGRGGGCLTSCRRSDRS